MRPLGGRNLESILSSFLSEASEEAQKFSEETPNFIFPLMKYDYRFMHNIFHSCNNIHDILNLHLNRYVKLVS